MSTNGGEHAIREVSEGGVLRDEKEQGGVDRIEAKRLIVEARRLYELAMLVQARQEPVGVESAGLAYRALTRLFALLVRVYGDSPGESSATLVERARSIAAAEKLLGEDLGPDFDVINDVHERCLRGEMEASPADARGYARAFERSAEWFDGVDAYIDQRLPRPKLRIKFHLLVAVTIGLAFAIGVVVGKRSHVQSPHEPPASTAGARTAQAVPAFTATYFRDSAFGAFAFSRNETSIDFNWGSDGPPGLSQSESFSVRWEGYVHVGERGKHTFFLTSDDGSRLFVDGEKVIDNWGNHGDQSVEGSAELESGEHAVRVEYFEDSGLARILLEWSSDRFARRAIEAADLRRGGGVMVVPVSSPSLSCDGCYPIEPGSPGAAMWTTGKADFALSGLGPGRYRVKFRITDCSSAPNIEVGGAGGPLEEVTLHTGDLELPNPVAVGDDGKLRWSLRVDAFSPKSRFPGSKDERTLGVSIDRVSVIQAQ